MRILKWFKISLLAALAALMTLACAACDLISGGGNNAGEGGFTGFLKGALVELTVGDDFNPKNYVDIVSDSDYTITISNDKGFSEDVTRSRGERTNDWELGNYKITYVVDGGENEGTYTFDLKVVAPRLMVFYTLQDEDMVMELNKPLVFEDYFAGLDFEIRAYKNKYTASMVSVVVGDVPFGEEDTREVISLVGQTSYTPTVQQPHYFTMKVESIDGQTYETLLPIRVAKIGDQVAANLQTDEYKNVTFYAYNEITNDMGVTFRTGFTRASNKRNDIGYVGYEGNYGKGTYVKFDFTGNNLPKVVFFAPQFVNGLTGGDRGLLLNNGTVRTTTDAGQADCNKFGVYGPNKLSNASYNGSQDCLWSDAGSMLAWNNLKNDPTRQYTYIVGIQDCKDKTQVSVGQKPYVVIECIVLDRETEMVVYEKTIKIENENFTANYFSGNVQAYGAFGAEITFDKVYPIYTGIESIDEMYDSGPKFADTALKSLSIDADISVADYIGDTLRDDAVFGYIKLADETDDLYVYDDANNKRINLEHPGFVRITTETFVISEVGQYRFLYQVPEERVPGKLTVTVSDPSLSDFESGMNGVIAGFETNSSSGSTPGIVELVDNVAADGNTAVKCYMPEGQATTNNMNLRFDMEFLNLIFTTGAEYFTFDMYIDLPYLRFAREGGRYWDSQHLNDLTGEFEGVWVSPGNYYLLAQANDVGFSQYTEKVEYNGETLYRFSIVYPKAAWLMITNNGTVLEKGKAESCVVFDFSSDVNTTSEYVNGSGQEAFEQTSANIKVMYIDNVRTGKYTSDDIDFEGGYANGNLDMTKSGTVGAADVVKYGDGYAMKVVTFTNTLVDNNSAFGFQAEYLHQVFNVLGAQSLTFKAYFDASAVDVDKSEFSLLLTGKKASDGKNGYVKAGKLLMDAFDPADNSVALTLTKDVYSQYFDANGAYTGDTLTSCSGLKLGMRLSKNGATTGKGTVVYFDNFKASMDAVIEATVSADNISEQYQGASVNVAELMADLTVTGAPDGATAAIVGVVYDGTYVDLTNETEFTYTEATRYTFIVEITVGTTSRRLGVAFNVDYETVYEDVLYMDSTATGTYTIELGQQVSNVTVNGEAVATENASVTATGIDLNKAYLAQYVGYVQVVFTYASGEMKAASLIVYPALIDFEDGQNYVIDDFGTYSQDGKDGSVAIADNVAADGNKALQGVSKSVTNLMNVNFNTTFLENIFQKGSADYFTFDVYCDVPYLLFVREGGNGNYYLLGEANAISFGENVEEVVYNGETLYRFSLVYPKAAWDKISNNGALTANETFSTLVFDFTGAIDKTSSGAQIGQTNQNLTKFYVDNIRIGNCNADDITFEDGNMSGNFNPSRSNGTSAAAVDVVKYGDGYALRVTAHEDSTASNTTAFGMQPAYLHEVFNVKGAKALTFKVYYDPATIDPAKATFKLMFNGLGSDNKSANAYSANLLADAYDVADNSVTYTLTEALYHTHFDADGNYILGSGAVKTFGNVRLGMNLTKGGYTVAKGTEIYFDDFKASMADVIDATVSTANVDTYYQGQSINVAELANDIDVTVTSYAEFTSEITAVSINGTTTSLVGVTDYQLTEAGQYVFTLKVSAGGGVRNINFALDVDYEVIKEEVTYVDEGATGTYEVNVGQAASNVTLNGVAVETTETATGFTLDKAVLAQNFGTNKVVFQFANGEMKAVLLSVCKTFNHTIDFENGEHYGVVLSYNNTNVKGANGSVAIAENIGETGNTALKGVNTGSQNVMCVQISREYLDYVFLGAQAKWFTLDMYMDVPAFGWARVGNGSNYYIYGYSGYGTIGGEGLQSEVDGVTYYRYTLVFPKAAYDAVLAKTPDATYAEICTSVGALTDGAFGAKSRTFCYFDNFVIPAWEDSYDLNDGRAPEMFQTGQQAAATSIFGAGMVERTEGDFEWRISPAVAVTQHAAVINMDYLAYIFETKGYDTLSFKMDVSEIATEYSSLIGRIYTASGTNLFDLGRSVDGDVYTWSITKDQYNTYIKGQDRVKFSFYVRDAAGTGIKLAKTDYVYIDDFVASMNEEA